MTWIMITKPPPIGNPPPKFSIFWAIPWPDERYAPQQLKTLKAKYLGEDYGPPKPRQPQPRKRAKKKPDPTQRDRTLDEMATAQAMAEAEDEPYFFDPDGLPGRDMNWIAARKIVYQGETIRVFPHEFSKLTNRNMAFYVLGDGNDDGQPSHYLIPETVAEEQYRLEALDGDLRPIYDAALVDGCTPNQALLMAMGVDVSADAPDIQPLGWYRLTPENEAMAYELYGET